MCLAGYIAEFGVDIAGSTSITSPFPQRNVVNQVDTQPPTLTSLASLAVHPCECWADTYKRMRIRRTSAIAKENERLSRHKGLMSFRCRYPEVRRETRVTYGLRSAGKIFIRPRWKGDLSPSRRTCTAQQPAFRGRVCSGAATPFGIPR